MNKKNRLFTAYIILTFFIYLPFGCRRNRKPEIKEATFTRNGLGIRISRKINPKEVILSSANSDRTMMRVECSERKTDTLLPALTWTRNREYLVYIEHEEGILQGRIQSPLTPAPFLLWERPLGKAEGLTDSLGKARYAKINDWSKIIYEQMAVSSNGMVGVAGFDRTIRLWDAGGKKIMTFHIPGGVGTSIIFSEDNQYVLAGEASPEGKLYCFATEDGRLCWSYNTARELGTTKESYYAYQPAVKYLTIRGGTVFVSARRGFKDTLNTEQGAILYYPKKAVIFAFDIESGRKLWQFPEITGKNPSGLMDTAVLKLALDKRGQTLVFSGWGGSANGRKRQQYSENTVFILDAQKGDLLFSWDLEPFGRYGFQTTSAGTSIDLSPNGKFLACASNDGRLFLYDHQAGLVQKKPALLYQKTLSEPIEVSGIPLYAYGGMVVAFNDGRVLAEIGRTYTTPGAKQKARAPHVSHPQENTLFELDQEGNPSWIWRGGGGMEMSAFSADGRYIVLAMIHDYVNQTKEKAGIYCFDRTMRNNNAVGPLWFYPLEGIALVCAVSSNGKYIGALEGPIDVDPRPEFSQVVGNHRTLLIH